MIVSKIKKKGIVVSLLVIFIFFGYLYLHHYANYDSRTQEWQELTDSSWLSLKQDNFSKAVLFCEKAKKMAQAFNMKDTFVTSSQILMAKIYLGEHKIDFAEQSFKEAVLNCEKDCGVNSPKMILPLENLANFYLLVLKRYDKLVPVYQKILKTTELNFGSDHPEVAKRSYQLAGAYQKLKQYEPAEQLYKRSLAIIEKDKGEISEYLLTLADFYQDCDKCDTAEIYAKRATMLRENAVGPNAKLELAISLYRFAEIYLVCNKPVLADSLYSKSLTITENVLGKESSDLTKPMIGLAKALLYEEKYKQSEIQFSTALSLAEKNLGSGAPEILPMVAEYCKALNEMNLHEKAIVLSKDQQWKELMYNSAHALRMNKLNDAKLFCDSAMIIADNFGIKDTHKSKTLTWKAELYRSEGKFDLAEQFFKKAVTSCEKVVGPSSPYMVSSLESLANFYYYTRVNYEQVAQKYHRILIIVQQVHQPDYAEIASRARNLADVYCLAGKNDLAEPMFKLALESAEKINGSDKRSVVQYLQAFADFYRIQNKYNLAEVLAKRALKIREKYN